MKLGTYALAFIASVALIDAAHEVNAATTYNYGEEIAWQSHPPQHVPCRVFGAVVGEVDRSAVPPDCLSPLIEGLIDGQWVAIIFMFDGSNGEASELKILAAGRGADGALTIELPPIKAKGDRIDAWFHYGKLFVSNALYLSSEAHCCFTHLFVRRLGFFNGMMRAENSATVPVAANRLNIEATLAR